MWAQYCGGILRPGWWDCDMASTCSSYVIENPKPVSTRKKKPLQSLMVWAHTLDKFTTLQKVQAK